MHIRKRIYFAFTPPFYGRKPHIRGRNNMRNRVFEGEGPDGLKGDREMERLEQKEAGGEAQESPFKTASGQRGTRASLPGLFPERRPDVYYLSSTV